MVKTGAGWVLILGMWGVLAGCGDALSDLIEQLARSTDAPPMSPSTAPPPAPNPAAPNPELLESLQAVRSDAADAGAEPPGSTDAGDGGDAGAPSPDAGPPIEPPSPTSFETDVWPIFISGCEPCHTRLRRGGHSVGSPNLEIAYADAVRLGFTLIERLDGGGMPLGCTGNPGDPGCIAIDDLATIRAWLEGGSLP